MGELDPDFAGQGGFGAGAEDEESDGRRVGTEAFDVGSGACAGWVEGVSEGWRGGLARKELEGWSMK